MRHAATLVQTRKLLCLQRAPVRAGTAGAWQQSGEPPLAATGPLRRARTRPRSAARLSPAIAASPSDGTPSGLGLGSG